MTPSILAHTIVKPGLFPAPNLTDLYTAISDCQLEQSQSVNPSEEEIGFRTPPGWGFLPRSCREAGVSDVSMPLTTLRGRVGAGQDVSHHGGRV